MSPESHHGTRPSGRSGRSGRSDRSRRSHRAPRPATQGRDRPLHRVQRDPRDVPTFRRDDRAVSAVVGAILLVGLLVIVLITIRTTIVPIMEEDAQAAHMKQVAAQLSQIRSDADRQSERSGAAAVANPLRLGQGSIGFFDVPDPNDNVLFEPGGKGVQVSANRLRIFELDGAGAGAADEEWIDISGQDDVTSVATVKHLRLRIDEVGGTEGAGPSDGDRITITLTDADGDFVGDFRVMQRREPPDNFIEVRTRNADGTVVVNQPMGFFGTQLVSPYWVWVNDPGLLFDQVMAAADKPMTITLTEAGLEGEYTITYDALQGNDTVPVVGGGIVVAPFRQDHTGGTLTYQATNTFYVDQEWTLENGALILEQPDGAVLRVAPRFRATVVGNQTALTVHVPTLVGDRAGIGGDGTLTVGLEATDHRSFVGAAPRFSVNVTTDHPALWAAFWTQRLNDADLFQVSGHFTVRTGQSWANVTVYGLTTDPASTEEDLTVTFRQSTIQVKVET